jgi:hypothetical protein
MDNFDVETFPPDCGGKVVPSVVDLGQSLPQKDLALATGFQ